jgi:kynureninase
MSELRAKSKLLTAYLEYLLTLEFPKPLDLGDSAKDAGTYVDILTPSDPEQRGAQLSVQFSLPIQRVFTELVKCGVVLDKREPNVLRMTPCPIYNSFEDIHRFMDILRQAIAAS